MTIDDTSGQPLGRDPGTDTATGCPSSSPSVTNGTILAW